MIEFVSFVVYSIILIISRYLSLYCGFFSISTVSLSCLFLYSGVLAKVLPQNATATQLEGVDTVQLYL